MLNDLGSALGYSLVTLGAIGFVLTTMDIPPGSGAPHVGMTTVADRAVRLGPPSPATSGVPMVCDVSDAGPREHVRAAWDVYATCFGPGGAAIECPKRKDACLSVESWRCHPTERPDVNIVGMESCRGGWRESLDGG